MSDTTLPRPPASLDEIVVAAEQAINRLEDNPLVGVVILQNVAISPGGGRVYHGLGQRARGCWIVRATVDVRVALSDAPDAADPAHFMFVSSSTAAVVDLAVY
jgi:hypothetical protein